MSGITIKTQSTQTASRNIPLQIQTIHQIKQPEPVIKKPPPRKDKMHISKFLILVNSNKAASVDEKYVNEIAACLRDGIGRLLQEHTDELFKLHPRARPGGLDTIENIAVKTAAEIGPKYHRIHVHSLLTVHHRTLLQLNKEPFDKYLPEYCKNPYFDSVFTRIRFVPVSNYAEEYLYKNPAT